MKAKRISRMYVIDSDVAFYGSVPLETVSPELHPLCIACSMFLARAAYHGSELHVPSVFLSNVSSLTYRDLVASEIVTLELGREVLEAILGTHWEIHFPVWSDVFDIQHALKHTNSTSIAEFLSVASNLVPCGLSSSPVSASLQPVTNLSDTSLLATRSAREILMYFCHFPLGCAFISTNLMLLEEIGRSKVQVSTLMLTDHVWSQAGALEDHPPD